MTNTAIRSLQSAIQHPFAAYIFDLDGTVYLGDALLPTALETITTLREQGKRTLFLSNNPTRTREEYAAKLTRLGLPTPPEDVVNSSTVMVDFLNREMLGAHLFVVGEESLRQELERAGFVLTDDAGQIDAVIASFDRTFEYQKLQTAFDAIRRGARFFATNSDRYCPVPGGGQPDAAAVIAAIEACTNTKVEAVVGKPSSHMAQAILHLAGASPAECIMIGDRLETDVLMALNAGMAGVLTLTGATSSADLARSEIKPTYVITQLGELLDI
ncbi:MAG: HAD-IIA family hydrolase [Candidatus Promineifilaceae bacterium]|jgi:phosphoglycolate/pyridoxal phosphate phosphatase family enzyme